MIAGAVLRDHPLARLWSSHLVTAVALAHELTPKAATLVAQQSIDLLAHVLDDSHRGRCSPGEAERDALFSAACRVIALEFGNPDLTPGHIARALGVSSRTLARVFARHDETIMRRVFDERVRQTAKLLATPEAAHRSITEIAFGCGFNDLSHFGRAFAGKMQMTPSQFRSDAHAQRRGDIGSAD